MAAAAAARRRPRDRTLHAGSACRLFSIPPPCPTFHPRSPAASPLPPPIPFRSPAHPPSTLAVARRHANPSDNNNNGPPTHHIHRRAGAAAVHEQRGRHGLAARFRGAGRAVRRPLNSLPTDSANDKSLPPPGPPPMTPLSPTNPAPELTDSPLGALQSRGFFRSGRACRGGRCGPLSSRTPLGWSRTSLFSRCGAPFLPPFLPP